MSRPNVKTPGHHTDAPGARCDSLVVLQTPLRTSEAGIEMAATAFSERRELAHKTLEFDVEGNALETLTHPYGPLAS